jgi:hypothetical protein
MVSGNTSGYLWVILGLFFMIFFGGKLFIELVGVIIGFVCIMKGLKILSFDRQFYHYSMHYFNQNFRR